MKTIPYICRMYKVWAVLFLFLFISCRNEHHEKKLPTFGNAQIINGDFVFPVIRDFEFLNQDSVLVSNETFKNKIYVADFIFLSCPSICPMMNKNMLHTYKNFQNNPEVSFLSHTIDPDHDNISRLKKFSDNLGVSSLKWHFVTGKQDSIYEIAEKNYFATAYKDSTAPGGYVHSGGLLLIDKNRHVRGVYDGTDSLDTERLISDMNSLLKE